MARQADTRQKGIWVKRILNIFESFGFVGGRSAFLQASKNVPRRQSQLTNDNDQLTGEAPAAFLDNDAQAIGISRIGSRPNRYLCIVKIENDAQAVDMIQVGSSSPGLSLYNNRNIRHLSL